MNLNIFQLLNFQSSLLDAKTHSETKMYQIVTKMLYNIHNLLKFDANQLLSHEDDTALTQQWLYILIQKQNSTNINNQYSQINFKTLESIGNSQGIPQFNVLTECNELLNKLLLTFPVQIQQMFFFQTQCNMCQNNQIKNKFTLVLQEPNIGVQVGCQFKQLDMLRSSGCSCQAPNVVYKRLPSILVLGNQSGNLLTEIQPALTLQGAQYYLFQIIIFDQKTNKLINFELNMNSFSSRDLVVYGAPFKEKGLDKSLAQAFIKNNTIPEQNILFMLYIKQDILDSKTNVKLSNCVKYLLLTDEDNKSIEMLESTGKKISLSIKYTQDGAKCVKNIENNVFLSPQTNDFVSTQFPSGSTIKAIPEQPKQQYSKPKINHMANMKDIFTGGPRISGLLLILLIVIGIILLLNFILTIVLFITKANKV